MCAIESVAVHGNERLGTMFGHNHARPDVVIFRYISL